MQESKVRRQGISDVLTSLQSNAGMKKSKGQGISNVFILLTSLQSNAGIKKVIQG